MILDTRTQLNAALHDPIMTVMNFLNEVVERHPNAISLAPGRPAGQFFGVERTGEYIEKFVQYFAKRSSSTPGSGTGAVPPGARGSRPTSSRPTRHTTAP